MLKVDHSLFFENEPEISVEDLLTPKKPKALCLSQEEIDKIPLEQAFLIDVLVDLPKGTKISVKKIN